MFCNTTIKSPKDLEVKIEALNNFSEYEVAFLERTITLKEVVLESNEFKERFLKLRPTQNRGYSQQWIYHQIMNGVSKRSECDNDLDFYLTLRDYESNRTLASTSMHTGKISLNRYHYRLWMHSDATHKLAGTLMHEYCHSMGFIHRRNWFGKVDRKSVPYLTGYLVRDLVYELCNKDNHD
jgi:hypothetical protein